MNHYFTIKKKDTVKFSQIYSQNINDHVFTCHGVHCNM